MKRLFYNWYINIDILTNLTQILTILSGLFCTLRVVFLTTFDIFSQISSPSIFNRILTCIGKEKFPPKSSSISKWTMKRAFRNFKWGHLKWIIANATQWWFMTATSGGLPQCSSLDNKTARQMIYPSSSSWASFFRYGSNSYIISWSLFHLGQL